MDSIIICRVNRRGDHNFYIEHNGRQYYLFTQDYHRGVNVFFSSGVSLKTAMYGRGALKATHGDCCVAHTMKKLTPYIKYVEEENGIKILESKQTIRKHTSRWGDDREWMYEDVYQKDDEDLAC